MTIEDLKALETKATPSPWSTRTTVCDCSDDMCGHPAFSYAFRHCNIDEIPSEDLDFLVALRNLAPELIAIANAALKLDGTRPGGLGLLVLPALLTAAYALQDKMESL
jgi:hypothetical protein